MSYHTFLEACRTGTLEQVIETSDDIDVCDEYHTALRLAMTNSFEISVWIINHYSSKISRRDSDEIIKCATKYGIFAKLPSHIPFYSIFDSFSGKMFINEQIIFDGTHDLGIVNNILDSYDIANIEKTRKSSGKMITDNDPVDTNIVIVSIEHLQNIVKTIAGIKLCEDRYYTHFVSDIVKSLELYDLTEPAFKWFYDNYPECIKHGKYMVFDLLAGSLARLQSYIRLFPDEITLDRIYVSIKAIPYSPESLLIYQYIMDNYSIPKNICYLLYQESCHVNISIAQLLKIKYPDFTVSVTEYDIYYRLDYGDIEWLLANNDNNKTVLGKLFLDSLYSQKPETANKIWSEYSGTDVTLNYNEAFLYSAMHYPSIAQAIALSQKDNTILNFRIMKYGGYIYSKDIYSNCPANTIFYNNYHLYFYDYSQIAPLWDPEIMIYDEKYRDSIRADFDNFLSK
jgi:hypothetical protein